MSHRSAGALYLSATILLQTASLAAGKVAAVSMQQFAMTDILSNRWYALSLGCLVLQAFAWQLALTRYPLAHAYAATSVLYVNILILSAVVFHEKISTANAAGSVLIIAGVVLLNAPAAQPETHG